MFYLIQEEEMAILDNLIQFLYAQYLLLISLSLFHSNLSSFLSSKQLTTHINTMKHYSAIERNEIGSFAVMWMDLRSITQSGISQKKRKTNII